ncbi:MAG: hypothetical protein AAGH79_02075 [Bacteroidota bacterium]
MKLKNYLLLLLVSLSLGQTYAQNCSSFIADDRVIGGTHLLKTHPQTLVVRGNYSYSIELLTDDKGVLGKMYSKAGVDFNQGDEIIFMDDKSTRKAYRFIEMGEMKAESGTPVHVNLLQLDVAAVDWFSNTNIVTIYIKNNISNEMRKFTVNASRQSSFRASSVCFGQNLEVDKINDVVLVGNDLSSRAKISSTGPRTEGVSSTQSSSAQPAKPTTDQELEDLNAELAQTKEAVRAEIKAEQDKADGIKRKIQEEIALAREQGEAKKAEYAQEVLASRQKSQEQIEKNRAEVEGLIKDARSKASTEIEKINATVAEAKQNAAEEIQAAHVKAAEEVAAARENAASEIKKVKENLELAKIEYADEIATARENSERELGEIRAETAKMIADAREKAKTEQNATAEEVVEVKKTASEQILQTREETAAEIARIRENAVLEKEKLAFEIAESRRKAAEEKAMLQETSSSELAEIRENVAK